MKGGWVLPTHMFDKDIKIYDTSSGKVLAFPFEHFYSDMTVLIRDGTPFNLSILDIDNLKFINNTYGYSNGNLVISNVENKLLSSMSDFKIYKKGGAEFILVHESANVYETFSILENLRKAMGSICHLFKEDTVCVSVSIGTDPFKPQKSIDTYLENAYKALYYSKLSGADKTTIYNKDVSNFYNRYTSQSSDYLEILSEVELLTNALEARDAYTSVHSKEVMQYSILLASKVSDSAEEIMNIGYAALIHDIGKIGISDTILLKDSRLTDCEYKDIRRHPEIGFNLLNGITQNRILLDGVLYHHENYNGSGYPCGLLGEHIPLVARIISVVDSYQAMTSNRPYRKALSKREALEELNINKGIKYDPDLVDTFIELIDKNIAHKNALDRLKLYHKMQFENKVFNTKHLESIYGSDKVYITVMNRSREIEFMNNNYDRILSLKDKREGMTCHEVLHKSKTPCKGCTFMNVVENQSIYEGVKKIVDKNGNYRQFFKMWIPIVNENKVEYIVEIAVDPTS